MFVLGCAVAIVALLCVVALMATTPNSQNSTGNQTTESVRPSRTYHAMANNDDDHGHLWWKVYQESGRIWGEYRIIGFSAYSDRESQTTKHVKFTGHEVGGVFTFINLVEDRHVTGHIERGSLILDSGLGLQKLKWQIIKSKAVFDAKIEKYAKDRRNCDDRGPTACEEG